MEGSQHPLTMTKVLGQAVLSTLLRSSELVRDRKSLSQSAISNKESSSLIYTLKLNRKKLRILVKSGKLIRKKKKKLRMKFFVPGENPYENAGRVSSDCVVGLF